MAATSGAFTFYLWNEKGPEHWYVRGKNPSAEAVWHRLVRGMLPVTGDFVSLLTAALCGYGRHTVGVTGIRLVFLVVEAVSLAVFAVSGLASSRSSFELPPLRRTRLVRC